MKIPSKKEMKKDFNKKQYCYYIDDKLINENWAYDETGLYIPYNSEKNEINKDSTIHDNIYLKIHRIEETREKIELSFQWLKQGSEEEYIGGISFSYNYALNNHDGFKKLNDLLYSSGKQNKNIGDEETYIEFGNYFVAEINGSPHLQILKDINYKIPPLEKRLSDFKIDGKNIIVTLFENKKRKWIEFKNFYDNINFELDFKVKQIKFVDTTEDKEIAIVTFRYRDRIFHITKPNLEQLKGLLKEWGYELPDNFVAKLNMFLRNLNDEYTKPKLQNKVKKIGYLFYKRAHIGFARKELGNYLNDHGMILRKSINAPYLLDKNTNGYDYVTTDDIIILLNKNTIFCPNSISNKDVEEAITFIKDRRKPQYNIVKFNNCIYDMENFKVITPEEEAIFTLTEVKHDYNPDAKGDKIKEFLRSSLHQKGDTEEEEQNRITAFLEMIGYLLTSGNRLNAFFIVTGIGGSGKGVAGSLITNIFGSENVGGLQLQELTPDNRFATAHLESKQVNIVHDSPNKPIRDTGLLKQITGYDDIPCEPKGKDKYMIPKEEVPDMILFCNNIPDFADGFETAIIQRTVLFEFKNRFRGTDKQNKNLEKEILEDPEEMQWLIYNGIEAYKKMVETDKDFIARANENTTLELLGKHSDPISHILEKLVVYDSKKCYNEDDEKEIEDPIVAKELKELILFVAEKEGIAIDHIDKNGMIESKYLVNKIRKFLDNDEWSSKYLYVAYLGKSETIYPCLRKTDKYYEYLEQMTNEQSELN